MFNSRKVCFLCGMTEKEAHQKGVLFFNLKTGGFVCEKCSINIVYKKQVYKG